MEPAAHPRPLRLPPPPPPLLLLLLVLVVLVVLVALLLLLLVPLLCFLQLWFLVGVAEFRL